MFAPGGRALTFSSPMSKRSSAVTTAPPPKKRSRYHVRRYGEHVDREPDVGGADNAWSTMAERQKNIWLHVWYQCSFTDLYRCSLVCRRWRATLMLRDNDRELWGTKKIDGRWMLAMLPYLAYYNPLRSYITPARFASRLTFFDDKRNHMTARAISVDKIMLPRVGGEQIEQAVARVIDRWHTVATFHEGARQRKEVIDRRRRASEARRNSRRLLTDTINHTLLNSGRAHVDQVVQRVVRAYVEQRGRALPDELAHDSYDPLLGVPYWLRTIRRRCTEELLRRHSRSLMRIPSIRRWPFHPHDRLSALGVYCTMFDWLVARHAPATPGYDNVFIDDVEPARRVYTSSDDSEGGDAPPPPPPPVRRLFPPPSPPPQ